MSVMVDAARVRPGQGSNDNGIRISSPANGIVHVLMKGHARAEHVPLAGEIFVVDPQGKLLRTLTLPSLQVPNFAFSPDEKTLYVMGVDQIDKSPFLGKVYSIPNR